MSLWEKFQYRRAVRRWEGRVWASFPSLPRVPVVHVAVAILFLAITGLVQGVWTQRWASSEALEQAAERLDTVPMTVGVWQGTPAEMDPEIVARAGLTRCWMRNYTEARTGARVSVLLMCGRAGPTAVHTPEWCYGGAGYALTSGPDRRSVPLVGSGPSAEFWTARFAKSGPADSAELRIYWSWKADGQWQAPDHPRLTFARVPALYKLYVLHDVDRDPASHGDDATLRFMGAFLPQLNASLFPAGQ